MNKPISLSKIRKKTLADEKQAKADQNSVKFGRTKAARLLEAANSELVARKFDQLKFEEEG